MLQYYWTVLPFSTLRSTTGVIPVFISLFNWINTAVLLQYYWNITGILLQYYWNITAVLLEYYCSITGVIFQYYSSITLKYTGRQHSIVILSNIFAWVYKKIRFNTDLPKQYHTYPSKSVDSRYFMSRER